MNDIHEELRIEGRKAAIVEVIKAAAGGAGTDVGRLAALAAHRVDRMIQHDLEQPPASPHAWVAGLEDILQALQRVN